MEPHMRCSVSELVNNKQNKTRNDYLTELFHSTDDFVQNSKHGHKLKKSILTAVISVIIMITAIFTTLGFTANQNKLFIYDSNQSKNPQIVYTKSENLQDIIKERNITVSKNDDVNFTGFKNKEADLKINRAFEVKIKADGKNKNVTMTTGNVKQALQKADIKFSQDDVVIPALTKTLNDKTNKIEVKRVKYRNVKKTETVPFKKIEKDASWLKKGTTKVSTKGKSGKRTITYKNKYLDGKLIETKKVSQKTTKKPKSQITLKGTGKSNSVSTIKPPANFELNSKGVPKNYSKVLTGLAKSYTARKGAKTASGRPAMVGNVAVNPKIIPYGTKMYITSKDGKFVYGIAVASDTGGCLKKNNIIVDLYFDTLNECYQFGAKDVNIYILK